EKDLAARAHSLLEREAGRPLPAVIRVIKRVPVGGGLGGGSSDAAAALLATNEAFGLALSLERLSTLSRELGSDVAYFLDDRSPPRPAVVEGLGDRIRRLAPAAGELLLLIPPFGCPTGEVYRAFDAQPAHPLRDQDIRDLASEPLRPAALFNDLTPAAAKV